MDKKKDTTMSIWRFIITYVVLMGLFFIVMGFAPIQEYFDVNDLYSRAVVLITSGVLNIFNIKTTIFKISTYKRQRAYQYISIKNHEKNYAREINNHPEFVLTVSLFRVIL